MLDIDFLTARAPFCGTVIYRYRSGLLRSEVFSLVEELSRRTGGMHAGYDCDELIARWHDTEAFWPGIRVCELPASAAGVSPFRRMQQLFATAPGQPTIILMRAANYNQGRHAGTLVIEETVVSPRTIRSALKYIAETSDLPDAKDICEQSSFQDYFRDWIDLLGEASLPDLAKEFDRSILLYSEPKSVIFNPPDPSNPEPTSRALIVQSLDHYLRQQDDHTRVALLRAVAIKLERGQSDCSIVDDVLAASCRILSRAAKKVSAWRVLAGSFSLSSETAILWGAVALAWAKNGSGARTQARSPILIELDHLCHEFEGRLVDLTGDPLSGRWSDIAATDRPCSLGVDEDEPVLTPLCRLGRALLNEAERRRSAPWITKLIRALSKAANSYESTVGLMCNDKMSDLRSFADVVGQNHIIAGIRERFEQDRHDRPLLVVGPPGSGKQTVATLYARALLCESKATGSIDPCYCCVACRGFSRAGSFGYAELDLSAPNVLAQSRHILGQLRFSGFSDRRVVVLKNADGADEVMDAFLKNMEEKNTRLTYVVLAKDEKNVRAAALSRAARFRLREISEPQARAIVDRVLPAKLVNEQIVRLIGLHGDYRPGLMWHLSKLIDEHGAATVRDAKELLDLGWAERAIEYFQAFFTERNDVARGRLSLIDVDPARSVERLRKTLAVLYRDEACKEEAFLDLDLEIKQVRCAATDYAIKHGKLPEELWQSLARHWQRDIVIDFESLSEIGIEAEAVLARIQGAISFSS